MKHYALKTMAVSFVLTGLLFTMPAAAKTDGVDLTGKWDITAGFDADEEPFSVGPNDDFGHMYFYEDGSVHFQLSDIFEVDGELGEIIPYDDDDSFIPYQLDMDYVNTILMYNRESGDLWLTVLDDYIMIFEKDESWKPDAEPETEAAALSAVAAAAEEIDASPRSFTDEELQELESAGFFTDVEGWEYFGEHEGIPKPGSCLTLAEDVSDTGAIYTCSLGSDETAAKDAFTGYMEHLPEEYTAENLNLPEKYGTVYTVKEGTENIATISCIQNDDGEYEMEILFMD